VKCKNCGSEMEWIGQVSAWNPMYACRKCDPNLFKELEKHHGQRETERQE